MRYESNKLKNMMELNDIQNIYAGPLTNDEKFEIDDYVESLL